MAEPKVPDGQRCILCSVKARRGYITHTAQCPQWDGKSQHLSGGNVAADAAARYELFVGKLTPAKRRDRYVCPSCGDERHGGLKVDPGYAGPVFYCFGCCGGLKSGDPELRERQTEILEAVGMSWSDILGERADRSPPDDRRQTPVIAGAERCQTTVSLPEALAVYRRWLYLDDDAPVLAVAATVAANNAEGDPLWTLLVGPPSSGKTEALAGIAELPYVHGAATVTESSLLSGVAKRDRDKDATGGLLRQIGEYGVILCKDFTSVLSQNKDSAAAALAAMREVYDGSWDRPVGAGGGRVLTWRGKCGFVGGVTGSLDRFGQVIGALGDRFLLLRLPDVAPEEMAAAALAQGSNQKAMRTELAEAMTGLIAGADLGKLGRDLEPGEAQRLVALSTFTARARTVVERNSYTGEILVLPQPEGTARIVGQLRRLYGGLEAIGCDEATAWSVVNRVAIDCVSRTRARVMRVLMAADAPVGTGDVARALGVDWKTAGKHLGDLRLLELAGMDIEESGGFGTDKARYLWSASQWLRNRHPLEEKYPPSSSGNNKAGVDLENGALYETPRTSPPKAPPAAMPRARSGDGLCAKCGAIHHRYGPGGNPVCEGCRSAEGDAA